MPRITESRPPLHLATPHQDPTIVQSLIKREGNMKVRDDLGSTTLSLAILDDDFKVIELLIQHDAGVNIPNDQDQSPLHLVSAP